MSEKLAKELMDAANSTGASVKRKKILIRWQKRIKHLLMVQMVKYKESRKGGNMPWVERFH